MSLLSQGRHHQIHDLSPDHLRRKPGLGCICGGDNVRTIRHVLCRSWCCNHLRYHCGSTAVHSKLAKNLKRVSDTGVVSSLLKYCDSFLRLLHRELVSLERIVACRKKKMY